MSDPKDIARIGYVINNFDDIDWVRDGKGNIKTTKKYNDKNNNASPIMSLTKKVDGTFCVSQAVPDSKKKTIWITSARIQKKKQGSNDVDTSLETTPNDALVSSNISISQKIDDVNDIDMHNPGNNSTFSKSGVFENKNDDISSESDIINLTDTIKSSIDADVLSHIVDSFDSLDEESALRTISELVIEQYKNTGDVGEFRQISNDNGENVLSKLKEISEVNQNVNTKQTVSGRTDIHNENLGRETHERTGEHGERVSEETRRVEGKSTSERKRITSELNRNGDIIYNSISINDRYVGFDEIPTEYISDDPEVSSIISSNRNRGKKTVFISGKFRCEGIEANGVSYGDTVYISYDDDSLTPTQINDHEVVHVSAETEAYRTFKSSVYNKLSNEEKTSLRREFASKYDSAVTDYLNQVHKNTPNLTGKEVEDLYNAYLDEEILANLNAGTITLSVDVSEDIAEFRKAIGGYETSETETTLVDSESKANNSPADYKNDIDAGPRFNLHNDSLFEVPQEVKRALDSQINKWLNGNMKSNESFDFGVTPYVLRALGADELPVVMSQDTMAKVSGGKHSITLENIREVLIGINDPIMVFSSATVPGSFLMLTESVDLDGRSVVAAIHLNKRENRLRINRVSSIYGKDNVKGFVTRQFAEGNVKYLEEIKSQDWSTSRGLQLPKLVQSNPDNNSILHKKDIVNMYSMQKSTDDTSNDYVTNSDIRFNIPSDDSSAENQTSVMWTYSEGILDKAQISRFYTEIGKINKRGSKNYYLSSDDEYIIDIDNHLVYTDGNYDNPVITKVITFNSEYENDNLFAKELILDDERTQSSLDYAFKIIKEIYGEGYVIERNMAEHSAIGRQIGRGKGKNSRTASSTDEIRFDISSEDSNLKTQHYIEQKAEEIVDIALKAYSSKADNKKLSSVVESTYNDYVNALKAANGDTYKINIAKSNMSKSINKIATEIVENAETKSDDTDYRDLRKHLDKKRIRISDNLKADVDYNTFRKKYFGSLNLTNDGAPIDTVYVELCEVFPHLFDNSIINPADQLLEIGNVLDSLKSNTYNPFSRNMDEVIYHVSRELSSSVDSMLPSKLQDMLPKDGISVHANVDPKSGIITREIAVNNLISKMASRMGYVDAGDTIQKNGVRYIKAPSGEIRRAVNSTYKNEWETKLDKEIRNKKPKFNSLNEVVAYLSKNFGIPISVGKTGNKKNLGIFKVTPETIRIQMQNDLPVISHEVGHYLDKKYKLSNSEYIQEAIDIADNDFLSSYSDSEKPGEAVAEFLKLYMQSRFAAKQFAPNFYDEFVNTIDKSDIKILNTAAEYINEYMSSEKKDRLNQSIVTTEQAEKTPVTEMIRKAKTDVQMQLIDGYSPINKATNYVVKTSGKDLVGMDDAYKVATNSRNASSVADYILQKGMTDLDGNINIGKSLKDCLAGVNSKKSIAELDKYLVLKHALEWVDPKTGGTKKRVFADLTLNNKEFITKQIAEMEKEHPEFLEVSKNLYGFQRNVMYNFLVKPGIMTQKTFERLNELYPNYVPFYRTQNSRVGNRRARASFANQKDPIMKAVGSGLAIKSPIENIVFNTEKMVKCAMRNRTMQVLAKYTETIDGFGVFMERVAPDMLPKTVDISAYKNTFNKMLNETFGSDDVDRITEIFDTVLGDEVVGFSPVANAKEKIVTVLVDGKYQYYQIHDEALYKAVAELSPQQLNKFCALSQKCMLAMKVLITTYNPLFTLSNVSRDTVTAYRNSIVNNPGEYVTNYLGALWKIIRNSDDYKAYKAAGGGHASNLSATRDIIVKDVRRIYKMQGAGVARRLLSAIIHPIHTVSSINDYIEQVPRFAEYTAIRKKGGDTQAAIYAADDITVNFKRNGATGKNLNAVFMYNNAAIQGLSKLVRSFKDVSPRERNARIAKYISSAILTTALMGFFNKGGEEEEEAYENLSQHTKNNNYCFYIGDGMFLKLPKAREIALLDSFVERAFDVVCGDKDAFRDFGGYVADTLLPPMIPVPSDSEKPIESTLHSLLNNTVVGPIADVGFNMNYRGIPVQSDSYKYMPRQERYKETTSNAAIWLSNSWFGELTGLSPIQIDHIISGYGGYIGKINSSLFANNPDNRDKTAGFKNKFVADSLYSTDKVNIPYDMMERAKEIYQLESTVKNAFEYEKYGLQSSYISEMTSAIKSLPKEEQRNGRKLLMNTLNKWDFSASDLGNQVLEDDVSSDDYKYFMTTVPASDITYTKEGQTYSYQMTPTEYNEYVKEFMNGLTNIRKAYEESSLSSEKKAEKMADKISGMKESLKERWKKKLKRKFASEK